jgi:ubiquitin-like modifier-activating enzyme ATG7
MVHKSEKEYNLKNSVKWVVDVSNAYVKDAEEVKGQE